MVATRILGTHATNSNNGGMVGGGAPIEGEDGHVTEQKVEPSRTSGPLFSDPFVSGCAIEAGRRAHLVANMERARCAMETTGKRGEHCHEYEPTFHIHPFGFYYGSVR